MAVRIRSSGEIKCAALSDPKPGDTYLDDAIHYYLSVEKKVLVTTENDDHMKHGNWWWAGEVPKGVEIAEFYKLKETSNE